MEDKSKIIELCNSISMLVRQSTVEKQTERFKVLLRLHTAWFHDVIVDIIYITDLPHIVPGNVDNLIKQEPIDDSCLNVKLRRSERRRISCTKYSKTENIGDEYPSQNDSTIKDIGKIKESNCLNEQNRIRKKKLSCNYCSEKFLSRLSLREHLVTHYSSTKNINVNISDKVDTPISNNNKYNNNRHKKITKTSEQTIFKKSGYKNGPNAIFKIKSNKAHLKFLRLNLNNNCENSISIESQFQSDGLDCNKNPYLSSKLSPNSIDSNTNIISNFDLDHDLETPSSSPITDDAIYSIQKLGARRLYECTICTKSYANLQTLNKHRHSHHASSNSKRRFNPVNLSKLCLDILSNLSANLPIIYIQALPSKCLLCGKMYKKQYSLKLHLRTHTGERPHMCSVCGKGFFTGNLLTSHMRTHTGEKRHHCDICDKNFCQSFALLYHQRTFHAGVRPYACPCGKGFGTATLLRYHQMKHVGAKSFPCGLCTALFVTPRQLREHKEAAHVQTKKYKCKHCDKMFKRSQGLYRHMKVHSGLKTHKCLDCGKSFYQRSNMLTHMRTHTGVKPFACQLCNRSFSHNGSLKKHFCCVTQTNTLYQT